jgi:glycine betaine/choline ABC-type transport system substrate-binding protein
MRDLRPNSSHVLENILNVEIADGRFAAAADLLREAAPQLSPPIAGWVDHWTGAITAYAALDAKKVLAADVFSTDPPLAKPSKYTVLSDPKHVTGFQNVAPIVKTSVVTSLGSKFTQTVNAVSAKLTLQAIIAMNKAFYVDKQSAAKIAKAFLKANGLA